MRRTLIDRGPQDACESHGSVPRGSDDTASVRPPRWKTDSGFERSVTRYRDGWLRLAIVLCGNRADGEDVLQDGLVALARAWERVERRGVDAYMRRILVNKVIDRSRALRETPVENIRDASPSRELLRYEEDQHFFDMLRRLPQFQRAALVCRYYLDMPDSETAELLQCAPATVRSHVHRGLETLRRQARDHPREDRDED